MPNIRGNQAGQKTMRPGRSPVRRGEDKPDLERRRLGGSAPGEAAEAQSAGASVKPRNPAAPRADRDAHDT